MVGIGESRPLQEGVVNVLLRRGMMIRCWEDGTIVSMRDPDPRFELIVGGAQGKPLRLYSDSIGDLMAWAMQSIAYLVLDTETSGLPLFREPADDPRQPYIAQACMIALDEDLCEVGRRAGYVKPNGWVMEPGASKANGLTTEYLMEVGEPIAAILDHYAIAIAKGATVIAHNAQFDCKMMRGAMRRAGRDDMFEQTNQFCTMRKWAERNGGKWPKMAELCAMLGVVHSGAHTAIGDAEGVVSCVRKLRNLGWDFQGEVHRSKYHKSEAAE